MSVYCWLACFSGRGGVSGSLHADGHTYSVGRIREHRGEGVCVCVGRMFFFLIFLSQSFSTDSQIVYYSFKVYGCMYYTLLYKFDLWN